ncbi:MAG: hypothetical protein GWN00_25190, partial [Aliifodinibius sp.]|nr:hypothetical protein [candidate division KSB1 bacterium]NIT59395.1 hypothetical protein [Fodinibius sp.]NIV70080.1 hypothetical protein [Phycisphaerae bacterium]NIS26081.1 hypothetical protein [candidate division KSB1 bacterium]NIU26723.1 hypothetical protein [candidate division KSB1 bacterium]
RAFVRNKYVHETHDFNDAFPRIYDIKLIHKDTPAKPVDAAKLLEPNSTRYSLIFNGKNRFAYGDQYNFLEQEYEEIKKQAPYADVKSTSVDGRIAYEVPKTFNPENAY